MQDIDRVTSAGEPPRRAPEPRRGKRARRFVDPEEPPPHASEDAPVWDDEKECSGTLDLRV
jgi:hypothetical protein